MFGFPSTALFTAAAAGGQFGHHVPVKSSNNAFFVNEAGEPLVEKLDVSLYSDALSTSNVTLLEVIPSYVATKV